MDAIGNIQPIVPQVVASSPSQGAPAVAPPANAPVLPQAAGNDNQGYDPQAAAQKRLDAVQKAAQNIANYYVVGDQVFTIFKDVTGQYITRFTSLRDGKVTYIPEPELFKHSDPAPVLKIKA